MRIAQVAPLAEPVPPRLYGGTERIVSWLTEELVRQGHDVTLFASGDSVTSAELVPACERALRLAGVPDPSPAEALRLELVRQRAREFDLLHFHTDFRHFPLARQQGWPTLMTMHGRLDLPHYQALADAFPEFPLVSISDDQRRPLRAKWAATIHHGLPRDLFTGTRSGKDGYLAFLGRICPEKRPDRAIEIAKLAGIPLRIAAKVDPADADYFEETIRPLLDHPLVEFVGEIGDREKQDFLGRARALLFPIDWPEPFGVALIESLACGTPVIAWPHGSVPEIIEPGRTGFLVRSVEEAAWTVRALGSLDRGVVRRRFEERFTAERMASDYLRVYATLAPAKAPWVRRTTRSMPLEGRAKGVLVAEPAVAMEGTSV